MRARRVEGYYSRQLGLLGDNIGTIIEHFAPGGVVKSITRLQEALDKYAMTLDPWAEAVASSMLEQVSQRDAMAWFEAADEIGLALRKELKATPIGEIQNLLMQRQVHLIKSLPIEAAERVHRLVNLNLVEQHRAEEIRDQILRSGRVTVGRAQLIARTEVARAQSNFTEARAKHIGSKGYIWRTVGDSDVRPHIGIANFHKLNTLAHGSHRKLEGTYHTWDKPPIAGPKGERAHPGCIYNCRCFAEPVLPDVI